VAIILIGGGARSGKSRFALEKARAIDGTRAFVATAQPSDEEMTARIQHHREERGEEFSTIEEPIELPRIIAEAQFDVLLIDCLTLWLSNTMFVNNKWGGRPRPQPGPLAGLGARPRVRARVTGPAPPVYVNNETDALIEAAQSAKGIIIFVTNEVGSGIVPTGHALSRDFRDRAGTLNQRIAAISDEVYFMVFGQSLRIK
jgi:adenosylcobinamide kinase/adenosylcobinamide-phosphate guanylyltransferase